MTHAEILLAGIKGQRHETDVRVQLGDNTGGGAVILLAITFRSVGIWIVTKLPSIQSVPGECARLREIVP